MDWFLVFFFFFYHFRSVSSSECKTLNIALVITVNFITSTLIGLVSDGEFSPEREAEIFWRNPFFQLIVEIGDVECEMDNNPCGARGTRGVRGRAWARAQLLGAPPPTWARWVLQEPLPAHGPCRAIAVPQSWRWALGWSCNLLRETWNCAAIRCCH